MDLWGEEQYQYINIYGVNTCKYWQESQKSKRRKQSEAKIPFYSIFTIHFNNFTIIFCSWKKMFFSKFRGSLWKEEKKKAIFTHLEKCLLGTQETETLISVKTILSLWRMSKQFLRPKSLEFSISDLEIIIIIKLFQQFNKSQGHVLNWALSCGQSWT